MFELIDWLQQHIPLEDSSAAAAGLVHGDFRIDNLVFHPIEVGTPRAHIECLHGDNIHACVC